MKAMPTFSIITLMLIYELLAMSHRVKIHRDVKLIKQAMQNYNFIQVEKE